jgi:WD40 repeat protein
MASGDWNLSVKFWRVELPDEITTMKGHTSYVTSVAFSPDGNYLASGSNDFTIILWSITSQKEVLKFLGHS